MEIRLGEMSFASLAKAAVLINLAAWLLLGLILAGLEAGGIAVMEPEAPALPLWERVVVSLLAALMIGAVHSVLLVAGAWLVRATGAGGPRIRLRRGSGDLSRAFE
jgi:hypothetical protein